MQKLTDLIPKLSNVELYAYLRCIVEGTVYIEGFPLFHLYSHSTIDMLIVLHSTRTMWRAVHICTMYVHTVHSMSMYCRNMKNTAHVLTPRCHV